MPGKQNVVGAENLGVVPTEDVKFATTETINRNGFGSSNSFFFLEGKGLAACYESKARNARGEFRGQASVLAIKPIQQLD